MIHTTEVYRFLKQIESTVKGSDTMRDPQALAAWTDETALRQIHALVQCALTVMAGEPTATGAAVALADPAPQSSVQIEGRAKGPPAITVKVYGTDSWVISERAKAVYDSLVADYDRTEGLNAAALDMLDVLDTLTDDATNDAAWAKAAEIVQRFGSPKAEAAKEGAA